MDKEKYKVSKKGEKGWRGYGTVTRNSQYGTYSLGLKITPEFKELVNGTNEGEWVNFSLFEDKPRQEEQTKAQEPEPDPFEF